MTKSKVNTKKERKGPYVFYRDYKALLTRHEKMIAALQRSLRWALDYGSWYDVIDGNPLMKSAYDRACHLVYPERAGEKLELDKDFQEALLYLQEKKKKLTRLKKVKP